MEERKLDSIIQEALEQRAGQVSMSSDLQRQIKQKIRMKSEEEYRMKSISKKKVILAAAAMCLLMSMVVLGAGKVAGWSTGHNPNKPEIAAYTDMKKAEKRMGCPIQSVEKFANGFQFDKGFLLDVREFDDKGTQLGTFPEVSLDYQKGEQRVILSIYPSDKATSTEKHAQIEEIPYGKVKLTYMVDHYKFVPENYEVTPQEQAAMDAGMLYVSYGADEVELKDFSYLSWDGKLHYQLMASGPDAPGKAELVQMAKELIDTKK